MPSWGGLLTPTPTDGSRGLGCFTARPGCKGPCVSRWKGRALGLHRPPSRHWGHWSYCGELQECRRVYDCAEVCWRAVWTTRSTWGKSAGIRQLLFVLTTCIYISTFHGLAPCLPGMFLKQHFTLSHSSGDTTKNWGKIIVC